MHRIEALLRLVLDDDYTVVADAIETARVSAPSISQVTSSICFYQIGKTITHTDHSCLTIVSSYSIYSQTSTKRLTYPPLVHSRRSKAKKQASEMTQDFSRSKSVSSWNMSWFRLTRPWEIASK